jgi:hypothetical protein
MSEDKQAWYELPNSTCLNVEGFFAVSVVNNEASLGLILFIYVVI